MQKTPLVWFQKANIVDPMRTEQKNREVSEDCRKQLVWPRLRVLCKYHAGGGARVIEQLLSFTGKIQYKAVFFYWYKRPEQLHEECSSQGKFFFCRETMKMEGAYWSWELLADAWV